MDYRHPIPNELTACVVACRPQVTTDFVMSIFFAVNQYRVSIVHRRVHARQCKSQVWLDEVGACCKYVNTTMSKQSKASQVKSDSSPSTRVYMTFGSATRALSVDPSQRKPKRIDAFPSLSTRVCIKNGVLKIRLLQWVRQALSDRPWLDANCILEPSWMISI